MAKRLSKRREKARQRKAARRKKRKASRAAFQSSRRPPRAMLRAAAKWPLFECWLTKEWQNESEIVQILVARRSPSGEIAVGSFLVDLGCLGVKSAFSRVTDHVSYRELRDGMKSSQDMIKTDDLNLVAKIIREGIAYAEELGFKPDPDYRQAMLVLGNADPEACDVPIPLGKDGNPFFVAGPNDNVNQIVNKLTRKLGPDGFHYMVPLAGDEELFYLDE
jgi:hypothetical protein